MKTLKTCWILTRYCVFHCGAEKFMVKLNTCTCINVRCIKKIMWNLYTVKFFMIFKSSNLTIIFCTWIYVHKCTGFILGFTFTWAALSSWMMSLLSLLVSQTHINSTSRWSTNRVSRMIWTTERADFHLGTEQFSISQKTPIGGRLFDILN